MMVVAINITDNIAQVQKPPHPQELSIPPRRREGSQGAVPGPLQQEAAAGIKDSKAMMVGALWRRVDNSGARVRSRFFGEPIATRVTQDVVRLLASELRQGVSLQRGMENGNPS